MTDPAPDRRTDPVVGIDLGTTNSLVAYCDAEGVRTLTTPGDDATKALGDDIVPSVVRYEPDADSPRGVRAVVGVDARERAPEFPLTTIASVKRLMGRSFDDAQDEAASAGWTLAEGHSPGGGQCRIELPIEGPDGEPIRLTPQEVSADILRELKRRAEAALGREVSRAVVTVPAYFDDAQRQATRDAGRLAGLEVLRIVNEPTAAALAHGLGVRPGDPTRHVAVYDLGGGTFDVSILKITPPTSSPNDPGGSGDDLAFFEVLSTAGDTRLGGDDVDRALVDRFARGVARVLDRVITPGSLDPRTRRSLLRFARGVKHRLSDEPSATVEIDLGSDGVLRDVVTRDELEDLMAGWVERTATACRRALRDARRRLPRDEAGTPRLDALLLVGGSTRVPLVRARAQELFSLEPYTALDPDRVVALGAAVQASLLSGVRRGALLLDVIPLSLGIETAGGAAAKLIMRNTSAPARAVERFSTGVDGQTSVKLNVVQGEREMASDCRSLGEFHLSGLPPMPAGVPKLEVAFEVDANGVLSVSAIEQRSGRSLRVQIAPNHGLTREEVERIERESVEHAREDMGRHRVADLIANCTLDLNWIGGKLDRFGGELPDDLREDLSQRSTALREMVERARADWRSVDPDAMHEAKEALDRASIRLQEIAITRTLADD